MDQAKVIAIIRSLIDSSSKQMLVQDVNRDYNEEVGEPIPFRKFGFGTLVEFLKASNQFNGTKTAAGIVVTSKTNENSAHVIEMRRHQSVSAAERKRRKKAKENSSTGCRQPIKWRGYTNNNGAANNRQNFNAAARNRFPPPSSTFAQQKSNLHSRLQPNRYDVPRIQNTSYKQEATGSQQLQFREVMPKPFHLLSKPAVDSTNGKIDRSMDQHNFSTFESSHRTSNIISSNRPANSSLHSRFTHCFANVDNEPLQSSFGDFSDRTAMWVSDQQGKCCNSAVIPLEEPTEKNVSHSLLHNRQANEMSKKLEEINQTVSDLMFKYVFVLPFIFNLFAVGKNRLRESGTSPSSAHGKLSTTKMLR